MICVLYARCQKNANVLLSRSGTLKASFFRSNWKEYCVLIDGFYLYKPTMIVFLTLCIPLYWRINKGPSKTQLHKNNKLTSYTFRPSRGHLQDDICTILGSIEIMGGREISFLIGFCYKSGLYI